MTVGMAKAVPFCFLFSEIDKTCLYGTMSLGINSSEWA